MLVQLVTILLILLIVDRWKPSRFVKLHQQLGNDWTYVPIFGNALKLIGNNEDRMKTFIQTNLQIYQRKYKAISFWVANKLFVVNIWRPRRKILVPTFTPRYVNKFVEVFETQSKVAAELLESRVGKGNFSCFDYFSAYSLDSICETVFGINMDVQQQSDHVLLNALKHSLKNVAARICQPWLHIDAIYKMLPVYAQQMHLAKIGNEFVDNMIYRTKAVTDNKDGLEDGSNNPTRVKIDSNNSNLNRNENTALSSDKSGPQFKTFVELLIDNSKEAGKRFTHEEIREETIVLAVAATDTSATAISFIIVLLALHQDVQDKISREIQEVLGDLDKSLKSEDLLKLKYTRAVIKESLRLYPPVPFITRHCEKDLELPTGLVLPRGCDIAISIWGIQRNPEHWGEDADVFNPDRFMTGKIPSNAFMAFSYGARNCIGQQYAMLSMTTTLVTMLRRYRFTPATNFKGDKNNPFRLSFDLMLKDVDNFTLQVEHRDNLVTC